jgi:hypothetical protein
MPRERLAIVAAARASPAGRVVGHRRDERARAARARRRPAAPTAALVGVHVAPPAGDAVLRPQARCTHEVGPVRPRIAQVERSGRLR